MPQAPKLVRNIWKFLYVRGYWRQGEQLTRAALQQAEQQGLLDSRFWLTSHLGWVILQLGRTAEALEILQHLEKEIHTVGEEVVKDAKLYNYLGQAYFEINDRRMLDLSAEYQKKQIALCIKLSDRHQALPPQYYLARVLLEQRRWLEAAAALRELVTEAQDLGWQRAEGYCAFRLGIACVQLGRIEEAEQVLRRAEVLAAEAAEPLLQAYVLYGWALYHHRQNQRILALDCATQSHKSHLKLGSSNDMRAVEELLQELGNFHAESK